MKKIFKIIFTLMLSFSLFSTISYAVTEDEKNLKTGSNYGISADNDALDALNGAEDFIVGTGGAEGIQNAFIKIARDLKNVFFIIAGLYFLIIVIKLLFSGKTEEEVSNFKKGIIWISVGIIVMQLAFYLINILFDRDVDSSLARSFIETIIQPLIELLKTGAGFFFLAIMLYSFFRMVTANGDDEKAKTGKISVLYAAIGFIIIKITDALINAIYGTTSNSFIASSTSQNVDLTGFTDIIVKLINWLNGFVGIIVILMIIYAGFLVLISAGDEEKLKKAKTSIIYVAIGLFILFANYLILTFFIFPETTI